MAAGDGASEQGRLASERVAKLKRQLEQAERDERAWTAGAAGEALVADKLRALESRGWLLLHDIHWPGRPKANLDHVLVGPGGVLVIDAKNWTGQIEMRHGVLYQGSYSRGKEITGVLQQSAALTALLEPQHRHLVQAWLCMVGQPEMEALSASGVRIQGLNTLTDAVGALTDVLKPATVQVIHAQLKQLLTGIVSPTLLTSAHIGKAWAPSEQPHRSKRDISGPSAFSGQHRSTYNGGPYRARGARSSSYSTRRSPKPQIGCWGAIGALIFLLAASGMLMNLATNITHQITHTSPPPTPAITRTLPPPK